MIHNKYELLEGNFLMVKLPRKTLRVLWLSAGSIIGVFVALLHMPGIVPLALLAAFSGLSSNWSA